MFNGIKKGNGKCADEYFVGKNLEEGVLSLYKYTYYDLKDAFKKIGKDINNSTFSHWIEDLELREKGLALKKGKKRVSWYLNKEGITMLFEYGKKRKIGYIKRLRETENNTYKTEVNSTIVKELGIKKYDELQKITNRLFNDYYEESKKQIINLKVKQLQQEIEQKQNEIKEILGDDDLSIE